MAYRSKMKIAYKPAIDEIHRGITEMMPPVRVPPASGRFADPLSAPWEFHDPIGGLSAMKRKIDAEPSLKPTEDAFWSDVVEKPMDDLVISICPECNYTFVRAKGICTKCGYIPDHQPEKPAELEITPAEIERQDKATRFLQALLDSATDDPFYNDIC